MTVPDPSVPDPSVPDPSPTTRNRADDTVSVDRGALPGRLHTPAQWIRVIARSGKRIVVLIAGCAILGAGVAMLALPGPGVLVIIVGLAVLATEFAWAERMLDRAASSAHAATSKVSSNRASKLALVASASGLVIGGGVVLALSETWRMAGASAVLAGLIGLGTQHPAVGRWLASRSATSPSTPSRPTHTDTEVTS